MGAFVGGFGADKVISDMAKKPNYGFEKRRKEQERQKKKDAKREERLQRNRDTAAQAPEEPAPTPQE